MKFYINEIILWLINGNTRKVRFENNKVNIITGSSGTGKSEILSIIDYCLFGSKPDITDEIINENVNWYGINFTVNKKSYTIARGKIINRKVSNQYYFSQVGEIPDHPTHKIDEGELKEILEKEFGITERTIFPVGGRNIKIGSKISPRYFLVFNTISGNIITDSDVFFDKQNIDRYRDALGTVFDLAAGIETEENLKTREQINTFRQELKQLRRKQTTIEQEISTFNDGFNEIIKQAKYYNLIEYNKMDIKENIKELINISQDYKQEKIDLNFDKVNKLKQEKNSLIRKVRNIKRFIQEYDQYKQLEKNTLDSLLPINVIKESQKIFEFPELRLLVSSLTDEFNSIKSNIKMKYPFDFNVKKRLLEYEEKIEEINRKIAEVPINLKSTTDEVSKLIFIGELKAKLELYGSKLIDDDDKTELEQLIDKKEKLLEELTSNLVDYEENKKSILNLLDELIDTYLVESGDALGNYKGFKSAFNYKEKRLELRKPKAAFASKVGSSSNHMFLHICLFLGLHELYIRQNSTYIPQFIILDQPSRPYYGEEEIKKDTPWENLKDTDKGKITIAMQLLNDFISYANNELGSDFQIIILEHIPDSIWQQAKLKNFHLVEEFRNGNALIRFNDEDQPF
jgi:energy-coupling factor transporter ATP-binding protein EcfA2